MNYPEIITFWFEILSPKDWWRKNEALDTRIRDQFAEMHTQVVAGKTQAWQATDEGRLAEVIVLDQFSRNMYRGQPASFAYDALALERCKTAVAAGTAGRLDPLRVSFLLMPYMHSESLQEHAEGLPLFQQYCAESTVEYETRHAIIIERFGRYPHRNEILGRTSSAEELEFLSGPGSSF